MMNLNLNDETAETRAMRAKIKATEHKINLLNTIVRTLVSGLLIITVVMLPILAH